MAQYDVDFTISPVTHLRADKLSRGLKPTNVTLGRDGGEWLYNLSREGASIDEVRVALTREVAYIFEGDEFVLNILSSSPST